MARGTVLTRRLGLVFMALVVAVSLLGAQAVGASNIGNQPSNVVSGVGQQPNQCAVCFEGITNIQAKTLFYASNYPNLASVEMSFTFVGPAASVSYAVQSGYAPAPPTPGAYVSLALQNSGQYAAYQYLTVGAPYRLYVKVVDTHGATFWKELNFWVS